MKKATTIVLIIFFIVIITGCAMIWPGQRIKVASLNPDINNGSLAVKYENFIFYYNDKNAGINKLNTETGEDKFLYKTGAFKRLAINSQYLFIATNYEISQIDYEGRFINKSSGYSSISDIYAFEDMLLVSGVHLGKSTKTHFGYLLPVSDITSEFLSFPSPVREISVNNGQDNVYVYFSDDYGNIILSSPSNYFKILKDGLSISGWNNDFVYFSVNSNLLYWSDSSNDLDRILYVKGPDGMEIPILNAGDTNSNKYYLINQHKNNDNTVIFLARKWDNNSYNVVDCPERNRVSDILIEVDLINKTEHILMKTAKDERIIGYINNKIIILKGNKILSVDRYTKTETKICELGFWESRSDLSIQILGDILFVYKVNYPDSFTNAEYSSESAKLIVMQKSLV